VASKSRGYSITDDDKIAAFIAKYGITICPPMGSPELAEMHKKKHLAWLDTITSEGKRRLGFYTPAEFKQDEASQRRREIYRKRKSDFIS